MKFGKCLLRQTSQKGRGNLEKSGLSSYPKLGVVCDVKSHFNFAYEARRGPKPDVNEFESLVGQALNRIRITTILADAGYGSKKLSFVHP